MRSAFYASLSALLLLAASSAAAAQSTLNLNGAPMATLPPGGILTVVAKLPAGAPAVIAFDVSVGPTTIFGEVVPLGFTAATGALGAVSIVPSSGVLATTVTVPNNPGFLGQTIYLLGLAIDPMDPNGLAFTTGASLTFAVKSSAGADRAGFVGDAIALDGASNASNAGALAAGDTIAWTLTSKPAGSAATLANAASLYPSLTPDLPGAYVAQATLSKNGVPLAPDATTITAFQASSFTLGDGEFHSESSLVLGGFIQPAASLASLRVNGANVPFAPDGSFFVPSIAWNGADVTLPIQVEVTSTGGTVAARRLTMLHGVAGPTTAALPNASRTHLTTSGFTGLKNAILATFTPSFFNAQVAASGTFVIVPLTLGTSASADPTGGSFSSATIAFAPGAADVLATTTITNVKINFDLFGKAVFIPWSTTGSVTANVTLTNHLKFVVSNGTLQVNVTSDAVAISGISASVGVIPSSLLSPVVNALNSQFGSLVTNVIQSSIDTELAIVSNGFELNLLNLGFNLLGKQYSQVLTFTSVTHAFGSVSGATSATLLFGAPATGPALPSFLAGAGALASFGASAPGGGAFDSGSAMTVDALNYLLARLTTGGFANAPLDALASGMGLGFGAAPFTAGDLALLLPTAGFERLPAAQLVRVKFSPTIAPVVRGNAIDASLALEFSGVRADFLTTPVGGSSEVSLLSLAFNAHAQLGMGFAWPKLDATLGSQNAVGTVLGGLPALEPAAIAANAPQFGAALESLIAKAIDQITLPAFPPLGGFAASVLMFAPFGGAAGRAAWIQYH